MKKVTLFTSTFTALCVTGFWLFPSGNQASEVGASEPGGNKDMAARLPEPVKIPKALNNFLIDYCYSCHEAGMEKGDFNIEDLSLTINTPKIAQHWQNVLDSLNAGEMPPKKKQQPSAKEKAEALAILSQLMVKARKNLSDTHGEVTLRRLNRREYLNSLESLLGVRMSEKLFPDDHVEGGYDTFGGSLFMSADQQERYLTTARGAVQSSLMVKPPKFMKVRKEAEEGIKKQYAKLTKNAKATIAEVDDFIAKKKKDPSISAKDFGFVDDKSLTRRKGVATRLLGDLNFAHSGKRAKDGLYLMLSKYSSYVPVRLPKFAANGRYRFKIKAGLVDPNKETYLELGRPSANRNFTVLEAVKVQGTEMKPAVVEIEIDYVQGMGTLYYVRQRSLNGDRRKKLEFQYLKRMKDRLPPRVWVDWVEVEGPLKGSEVKLEPWLPQKPKKQPELKYVEQVIKNFAKRAYRGQEISAVSLSKLMEKYKELRKTKPLRTAIVEPIAHILASPKFLYFTEPSDVKPGKRQLSDRELAIRLSYFLWSAPPDAELLQLAASGQLSKTEVLRQQVNRMIKDARYKRFVSAFTYQWLDMKRLDFFQFEPRYYLDFDSIGKASARKEIYETFTYITRQDRSLYELLRSDYAVINDVMADYYGINGVKGREFRKVKLPRSMPRGGLLTRAAALAMGSNGLISSPIERGAWVLRKLLNDSPPPAPANVPQLRHDIKKLSKREIIKIHTQEAQCYQCHRKIDPIGMALEDFNAAGKLRDRARQIENPLFPPLPPAKKVKPRKGKKGVAKVELPEPPKFPEAGVHGKNVVTDQFPFTDYKSLHDYVYSKREDFARGLVEELLEYALGRQFGFTDRDLLDSIIEQSGKSGMKLKDVIEAVVLSPQFRSK